MSRPFSLEGSSEAGIRSSQDRPSPRCVHHLVAKHLRVNHAPQRASTSRCTWVALREASQGHHAIGQGGSSDVRENEGQGSHVRVTCQGLRRAGTMEPDRYSEVHARCLGSGGTARQGDRSAVQTRPWDRARQPPNRCCDSSGTPLPATKGLSGAHPHARHPPPPTPLEHSLLPGKIAQAQGVRGRGAREEASKVHKGTFLCSFKLSPLPISTRGDYSADVQEVIRELGPPRATESGSVKTSHDVDAEEALQKALSSRPLHLAKLQKVARSTGATGPMGQDSPQHEHSPAWGRPSNSRRGSSGVLEGWGTAAMERNG